jgi:hypothetical protein
MQVVSQFMELTFIGAAKCQAHALVSNFMGTVSYFKGKASQFPVSNTELSVIPDPAGASVGGGHVRHADAYTTFADIGYPGLNAIAGRIHLLQECR